MADEFLKRYTDFPALIYLLKHRAITVLDPKSWDDTNDSHCLSVYKAQKSLKTLLALCFTETTETYHHWRVFAEGPSGICITFNRDRLLQALDGRRGMTYGSVKYLSMDEVRNGSISLADLPFVKRKGFLDECEFRIIYESKGTALSTRDFGISLSTIEKITLNPWIARPLVPPLVQTIRSVRGCEKLPLKRSGLTASAEWKTLVNKATTHTVRGSRA